MGATYLVSQCFYKGETLPEDILTEDLKICLQLTLLVHSLTTRQQIMLGKFLELLFNKVEIISQKFFEKHILQEDRNTRLTDLLTEHRGRCHSCPCHRCKCYFRQEEIGEKLVEEKTVLPPIPLPCSPPIPSTYFKIRSVNFRWD